MDRLGSLAIAAGFMVVGLVALTSQSSFPDEKIVHTRPCRVPAHIQPTCQRRRRRHRTDDLHNKTLRLAPRRYPLYSISEEDTQRKPSDSPTKSNMDIAWNIHRMSMKQAQTLCDDFAMPTVCITVS